MINRYDSHISNLSSQICFQLSLSWTTRAISAWTASSALSARTITALTATTISAWGTRSATTITAWFPVASAFATALERYREQQTAQVLKTSDPRETAGRS